jgi:hypothetical protein
MGASDQLTVDLDGLAEFATALRTIRAEMSSARSWMREFHGDLGGREVDRAISHFESHWSDGRSRVDKNCERLIELAEQAVEHLRKADDDLAAELRRSGEGS